MIAIILNVFLREVIYLQALNYLSYDLTIISIITGVSFGLLTPLLANYQPIRQSMSKNLRDSLDLSRSLSADAFSISIQKMQDVGMSMTQLALAILLVVVGILTYYGVPLSFLNNAMLAALLILGLILILVVIGMTFLCTLVYNYLERLILWITLATCCRKDRRIHSLILK